MAEPRPVHVFDIQRFCLHDGPGIRTTVFFKGCPLSCIWCQNPESIKAGVEIAFYTGRCQTCFACRSVCPVDAVLPFDDQRIDRKRCTRCMDCIRGCPHEALLPVGIPWTPEDLAREVLKDHEWFLDSYGGVTFSGGEPMCHPVFLEALARILKQEGVHLTLETCGFYRSEAMNSLVPLLDLIYFDLKHMDPVQHKKVTGRDNTVILDNFTRLSKVKTKVQARMPVIPGINDNKKNFKCLAEFLKVNGHDSVHLLPYHNMGTIKRERIGLKQDGFKDRTMTGNDLEPTKAILAREGIHAVIYD